VDGLVFHGVRIPPLRSGEAGANPAGSTGAGKWKIKNDFFEPIIV
jgi:hypothetical protein